MSDKNITSAKITADDLPAGQTDWDAVDALSDEDAEQAALSDPDAPPTPLEALAHFQRAVDVKAISERKCQVLPPTFTPKYYPPPNQSIR